ncbi:MAG: RsmB/NOP family class I SAM-dependent RNA methyltransferase [Bacteroidia bacterium]
MKLFPNIVHAVIRNLEQIFNEKKYADKVIERCLKSNPRWGARDRRFIAENTYEIVRWWRLLKEVSRSGEGDHWSIFGAWCLIQGIEIPSWEEFKHLRPEQIRKHLEEVRSVRAIKESIPDWLDRLGEAELKEKWDKELSALNEQAEVMIRVNTLRTNLPGLVRMLHTQDIETRPWHGLDDALVLEKRQNIFKVPEFKLGYFEIQDASSQHVAPFLDLKPGMRVIDACAGAGGKTLHIAARMENKGKIIALDLEQWKLDELAKRARRAGAFNIEPRLVDSPKVIKKLEASADRLLLDVPCSGLGVLRRNPDSKWKLTPERIEELKVIQAKILHDYSNMLKSGGIMVYSTCSILPSENAAQVQSFIKTQEGQFELLKEQSILPSSGSDGFYMAAMQKRATKA